MSLTKDRELVDLLYNSYGDLTLILAELSSLAEKQTQTSVAVTDHEHDKPASDGHAHAPVATEAQKALARAQQKTVATQQHLVQIIKLLIQNHTDATIIINEFEKIRTTKLLVSEPFALAHVIPVAGLPDKTGTALLK